VLEAEAARLTDARMDATEDWIDAELACGRHDHVQSELCRLLIVHPLRERLWRQRAVALYRAGRVAEALAACHEFRVRLADETGLDPSDRLGRLEYDILKRDPSLLEITPASVSNGTDDTFVTDGSGGQASVRHRHNLPAALTRFVGRTEELEDVKGLLRAYRLVTLTGCGGVGKTRLALEAAASVIGEHHDGVWLVELAPLRDDADVPRAVARALDVMVDSTVGDAVADHVAGYLAHRRVLLVLDNAEHVARGVACTVHRLLTSCPDVTVLVTSRELLRSPGEASYAVPPLSLPPDEGDALVVGASDAVILFNERARAARPGLVMTATDIAAIAKICRHLDGIPLAIELAAARIRMLGTRQIEARLDDCFRLLTTEACTGVAERHRTLRATLDWSYELLAPAERVALRRLAVFPDHFDLDAGVAVIDADAGKPTDDRVDGFTLLSRLVDKSLVMDVQTGADVRYRLLEPVRQYAAAKLTAAGETDMARRRHRDVFLDRPKDLWPLMTAQTRQQVHVDRENYRAALEWSWQDGDTTAALRLVVVQTLSWMCVGDAQGREWLERVLAEPEPAEHPARVRALSALALSLHDSGHGPSGRVDELLGEATALAERIADAAELAASKLMRVDIALTRGNSKEARSLIDSASCAYQHVGLPAGVGWCQHYLGWIAIAEDDYDEARVKFERALDAARTDPGGEWLLPHALADLAPLTALLGESERALRLADEAVAAARPFTARVVLAMALARAAETALLADDTRAAGVSLTELLGVLHDLGTRRWAADALELVAVVLERRGQHDDGAVALGASAALRAARGEDAGGVRAGSEAVRRSSDRLRDRLGPRFATQLARGAAMTPEVVMTEMRLVLGTPDGASVGVSTR
ncbi:MAG: hypothetical protein QOD72_2005, partial [Acidimicrobiaceae bacterium]|nr:hypothetical protein [Acidimicrobiaceae bacterium]